MRYFDSHSHYYDERFLSECECGVNALLEDLFSHSVSGIINIGTNVDTSRAAIAQAKEFPLMYAMAGFHPSDTAFTDVSPEDAISEIKALVTDKSNKCVGIGEIGFDYHYPETDKKRQYEFFDMQMQLAREIGMPVSIHDRDSHQDVLDMIKRYPEVRGVLHSYSGSPEMAKELLSLGYMISFSGVLTFKNAKKAVEVARIMPKDMVLIETDAPYLAPHPYRGTLNHSGRLEFTCRALAEALSIGEEECARLTEENARRFFGI